MAKKKEAVDKFKTICDKVDRLSQVYTKDSYWQTLKVACDFVRSEDGDAYNVKRTLEKEATHWPPNTSNALALKVVMDKIEQPS